MSKLMFTLLFVVTAASADINQDLLSAVSSGDTQAASLALANGANANCSDANGITPLAIAANDGFLAIASILVNKNAVVDQGSDAKCLSTPLWFASYTGQDQLVSYLASKGANLQSTGGCLNETPLQIAARFGHTSTMTLLQNLGAR
jgi:ankyrin repeat protein